MYTGFLQNAVVSVESSLATRMSEKVIMLIVLVLTIKWAVSIKPLMLSPVPSATTVFHISYLGTMLYYDDCMCKVCEDALHIVHIASHLQVLKQANKILFQCKVHTLRSFQLNLEVSQTIQRRKYLVLANWKQIKNK
jgi:hypothetical protein